MTAQEGRRYPAACDGVAHSEHQQDDQGGDPEESDQEGQEIRWGSVRVAHINERSLCLGIALGRGKPFAGKPGTERRGKQENS
jgi:hypothetical protein